MKIYRLITRNSYEREMFDKASLKLGLDKAVLQSMSGRENASNGVKPTCPPLRILLTDLATSETFSSTRSLYNLSVYFKQYFNLTFPLLEFRFILFEKNKHLFSLKTFQF